MDLTAVVECVDYSTIADYTHSVDKNPFLTKTLPRMSSPDRIICAPKWSKWSCYSDRTCSNYHVFVSPLSGLLLFPILLHPQRVALVKPRLCGKHNAYLTPTAIFPAFEAPSMPWTRNGIPVAVQPHLVAASTFLYTSNDRSIADGLR